MISSFLNVTNGQVLSVEQMNHLKGLGIATSGASMKFVEYPSGSGLMRFMSKSGADLGDGIDTFSLPDLLDLIPPRLKRGYIFKLYKVGDSFLAEYSCDSVTPVLYVSQVGTSLEVAYQALIWVVENNHLPKKFFCCLPDD